MDSLRVPPRIAIPNAADVARRRAERRSKRASTDLFEASGARGGVRRRREASSATDNNAAGSSVAHQDDSSPPAQILQARPPSFVVPSAASVPRQATLARSAFVVPPPPGAASGVASGPVQPVASGERVRAAATPQPPLAQGTHERRSVSTANAASASRAPGFQQHGSGVRPERAARHGGRRSEFTRSRAARGDTALCVGRHSIRLEFTSRLLDPQRPERQGLERSTSRRHAQQCSPRWLPVSSGCANDRAGLRVGHRDQINAAE